MSFFKNLVIVINDYLSGGYDGKNNGLALYNSTLIVRWIRGYKILIYEHEKYKVLERS